MASLTVSWEQYNALVEQVRQQVDQYNVQLVRARALETQINGLPCDGS